MSPASTALSVLALLLGLSAAGSAATVEWRLPAIAGHAPDVWGPAPNWRWDGGNPLSDKGATWTLLYQPAPVDTTLKPMVAGRAYRYNFVWRDGAADRAADESFDPATCYLERTLHAQSRPDGPGLGPASAVVFMPGKAGTHRIAVAGTVAMQSPTAGNALLTLALCDARGAVVKPLKEFNLNTADGHGGYPAEATWNDSVALGAGQGFTVRLQSVNPGPATAGRCSFAFSSFTVIRE